MDEREQEKINDLLPALAAAGLKLPTTEAEVAAVEAAMERGEYPVAGYMGPHTAPSGGPARADTASGEGQSPKYIYQGPCAVCGHRRSAHPFRHPFAEPGGPWDPKGQKSGGARGGGE